MKLLKTITHQHFIFLSSSLFFFLSIFIFTKHYKADIFNHQVLTDDIRIGDSVLVLPGETITVDGRVLAGRSIVDESMLIGESFHVLKEKDFAVSSGTMNWDGPLWIEASSTGSNSTICKIIRMGSSYYPLLKKMEILPVNDLDAALQNFVNKDDKMALYSCLQYNLEETRERIKKR